MKIHIEYCIKWNYGPEFDRVSNIIKSINPTVIIASNNTPPRSGAFEITINGKIFFSKLKTNCFPENEQIKEWLKND